MLQLLQDRHVAPSVWSLLLDRCQAARAYTCSITSSSMDSIVAEVVFCDGAASPTIAEPVPEGRVAPTITAPAVITCTSDMREAEVDRVIEEWSNARSARRTRTVTMFLSHHACTRACCGCMELEASGVPCVHVIAALLATEASPHLVNAAASINSLVIDRWFLEPDDDSTPSEGTSNSLEVTSHIL